MDTHLLLYSTRGFVKAESVNLISRRDVQAGLTWDWRQAGKEMLGVFLLLCQGWELGFCACGTWCDQAGNP